MATSARLIESWGWYSTCPPLGSALMTAVIVGRDCVRSDTLPRKVRYISDVLIRVK